MPERFRLKKPIGSNHVVDPNDTVRTKSALAGLGFFEVPEEGVTPWPDMPMIEAVAVFQRKNGLKVDGVVNPGGETEQAINAAIATGSDFGVIPGMERTQPRIGVEAFDPAVSARAHPQVPINIPVGPPGEIPGPRGPSFHDVINRGAHADQANVTLSAGGGHFGITPGTEKTKPPVEAFDPAVSDRPHPEAPIDINVGPPGEPTDFAPEGGWPRRFGEVGDALLEPFRPPIQGLPPVKRGEYTITPYADALVYWMANARPEEAPAIRKEIQWVFRNDRNAMHAYMERLDEILEEGMTEEMRRDLYIYADIKRSDVPRVRDAVAQGINTWSPRSSGGRPRVRRDGIGPDRSR